MGGRESMSILSLLIPISIGFASVILLLLLWAVKSGQFEDLEGPAHRILMDDDELPPEQQEALGPPEDHAGAAPEGSGRDGPPNGA
jgi:cbb3-type cytochrome oxidase maturation protein